MAFQQVVEQTLTVKRVTRVHGNVPGCAGHGVSVERQPMLVGILKILRLPLLRSQDSSALEIQRGRGEVTMLHARATC